MCDTTRQRRRNLERLAKAFPAARQRAPLIADVSNRTGYWRRARERFFLNAVWLSLVPAGFSGEIVRRTRLRWKRCLTRRRRFPLSIRRGACRNVPGSLDGAPPFRGWPSDRGGRPRWTSPPLRVAAWRQLARIRGNSGDGWPPRVVAEALGTLSDKTRCFLRGWKTALLSMNALTSLSLMVGFIRTGCRTTPFDDARRLRRREPWRPLPACRRTTRRSPGIVR